MGELVPTFHTELLVDVVDVILDRVDRDIQGTLNLLVALPAEDQPYNLPLSLG